MTRYLFAVDRFSAWIGKAFGWSIVLLTLIVGVSVIFRYLLGGKVYKPGSAVEFDRMVGQAGGQPDVRECS